MFLVFYPAVVRSEERRLEARFGEVFRRYRDTVPRWWPDFSLYREPTERRVRPRLLLRAYFNAMWFMWAFLLWESIEKLHAIGILNPLSRPLVWLRSANAAQDARFKCNAAIRFFSTRACGIVTRGQAGLGRAIRR